MSDTLPKTIGKYKVVKLLGEGGFGRVYEAIDPDMGRLVAVKVLTTQGSPDLLKRFQNEAKTAGSLQHNNIVTIFESGTHNGAPYIAMEYLQGEDLNRIMYGGRPLSLLEKVDIMNQVAQGLKCAHGAGVVHRDVKPANIKVQPTGVVKIMDFGIALTRNDTSRLTQKGDLVGTIRYMSPEQFRGLDVDTLCDIFAYGVIYYELVSGTHPFEASDAAAFMYKITDADPVPLIDLDPSCPPALNEIVMRAIDKDRDVRYQTLGDLLLYAEPLLLELQRERAAELLVLTRAMFDAGQIPEAKAGISEVIKLDSANHEAKELLDRIQKSAEKIARRPKVETLLKAAESDLVSRRFEEAVESLQDAVKLDPADPDIARRLKEARQQSDSARQSTRLLSDAKGEFDKQNLTLAGRLASQALEKDPKNPRAPDLIEAIRKNLEQRDNARRLKQALDTARLCASGGDFDEAIQVLLRGSDIPDPSFEIRALLASIRDQKINKTRQERLRSEKQALSKILAESRLVDALPTLQSLCTEFPEDRDLATLLADTSQQLEALQRTEAIREATEETSRLRANGDFAEAEATLSRLSERYRGDSEILYLLQDATRQRENYERQQRVADTVQRAEGLSAGGNFGEARTLLEDALREYSKEPALLEAKRKVEAQAKAHQRAERARQALASARAQMAHEHYDAAIGLLRPVAAEDPQNSEVEELLREARRQSELQRISRAIDQVSEQARALANAHNHAGAASALRKALQTYPRDTRLEGLLKEIEIQQAQWAEQQAERQRARAKQLLAEAKEAIGRKEWPAAEQCLITAAEAGVGAAQILELRGRVDHGKAQENALTQAAAAFNNGRFDEAETRLGPILANDPANSDAAALLLQIQSGRAAAEAAEAIRLDRRKAKALSTDRQYEAAIQLLKDLIERYGSQPDLESEIEEYSAASQRQRAVHRIAELRGAGDAQTVLDEATGLLSAGELPELQSHLKWAQATLEAAAAQPAQPDPTPNPALATVPVPAPAPAPIPSSQPLPSRIAAKPVGQPPGQFTKRAVAAGVTLLAVLNIVIAYRQCHPTLATLNVAPEQALFVWKQGTSAPAPLRVQVKANAAELKFSVSDEWLLATPGEGNPPSEVMLSAKPDNLKPASYSGLLVVSTGSVTKHVRVRLTVEPPDRVSTLSVAPAQVQFVWQEGTSPPEAQRVYVVTGESTPEWTFQTKAQNRNGDPWLIAVPGGTPRSELALSVVKIGGMGPGSYSGVVQVSAGTQTQSVRVTLKVEPPTVKPVGPKKGDTAGPIVSPPPPPPPPAVDTPPITDQPVDCSDLSKYHGLLRGEFSWKGDLPPNETLLLGRTSKTFKSRGTWKGELPGCEITFLSTSPGIKVEDPPSVANRFSLLRVKNISQAPISNVLLRWEVAKPKPRSEIPIPKQ